MRGKCVSRAKDGAKDVTDVILAGKRAPPKRGSFYVPINKKKRKANQMIDLISSVDAFSAAVLIVST